MYICQKLEFTVQHFIYVGFYMEDLHEIKKKIWSCLVSYILRLQKY